jgi:hypothetical protein
MDFNVSIEIDCEAFHVCIISKSIQGVDTPDVVKVMTKGVIRGSMFNKKHGVFCLLSWIMTRHFGIPIIMSSSLGHFLC